jgi:hypothetical protein
MARRSIWLEAACRLWLGHGPSPKCLSIIARPLPGGFAPRFGPRVVFGFRARGLGLGYRPVQRNDAPLRSGWQRKLKNGAARRIGARPQAPTVLLDDRTADRQAHSRGPESRTEMSTPPASVRSVLTSSSRGPSLVPVIASIALMIKFRTTCCSSTRSPETGGKVSTSFVCTETPFFSASVRMSSIASRIAALISTGRLRRASSRTLEPRRVPSNRETRSSPIATLSAERPQTRAQAGVCCCYGRIFATLAIFLRPVRSNSVRRGKSR